MIKIEKEIERLNYYTTSIYRRGFKHHPFLFATLDDALNISVFNSVADIFINPEVNPSRNVSIKFPAEAYRFNNKSCNDIRCIIKRRNCERHAPYIYLRIASMIVLSESV